MEEEAGVSLSLERLVELSEGTRVEGSHTWEACDKRPGPISCLQPGRLLRWMGTRARLGTGHTEPWASLASVRKSGQEATHGLCR